MFPEWVVSSVVVYNDDNDVDLRHLWTLKRKERPISFLIMARFSQIQECLQLFWLVMWSQDIWVYAVEREINYSRASFYKPLLFNCIAPTFSENLWHGTMTFTFLLRSFACLVWSTKRYYESTTMSLLIHLYIICHVSSILTQGGRNKERWVKIMIYIWNLWISHT